ncbi:hypothetical protein HDU67_003313 [Dinochytrium kinnereticum]|nr:hypothetical protein HDU67_003313 [Dinochytrium kinnereticum]
MPLEELDLEALLEDGVPVDSVMMNRRDLSPICFGQLTSLATIGLCSQELMFVSPNLGLLFMTTTLELLTAIPAEIGYMKSLKILSVARNRLTYLPETLGHLTKLTELRASENLLTSLPTSIGELTKLTSLHLDSNHLTSLPSEIGGNRSLITLDVSENPIKTLPAEVGRLKFLRRLRVEGCRDLVESFTHDLVHSPPTLRELSARVIVRHQVPILQCTQEEVKRYLASAHACSFCAGPYFESFVVRGRIVEKQDLRLPYEYRLCVPHWNTDPQRLAALFGTRPDTSPSPSPMASTTATPHASPPSSPSLSSSHRSATRGANGVTGASGAMAGGGGRRRRSVSALVGSAFFLKVDY